MLGIPEGCLTKEIDTNMGQLVFVWETLFWLLVLEH
jgi:hypothetical protein